VGRGGGSFLVARSWEVNSSKKIAGRYWVTPPVLLGAGPFDVDASARINWGKDEIAFNGRQRIVVMVCD
jgi:hypothetical protein